MVKDIMEKDVDYDDRDYAEEDITPRRSNWLIPLLLVPIFFVLGWVSNDFARTNPSVENAQQQYGIGAGPDNQVFPTPTPMSWVPTDTPLPPMEGSSGVTY